MAVDVIRQKEQYAIAVQIRSFPLTFLYFSDRDPSEMGKIYRERMLTDTLLKLSNSFKAILISGPRQIGKTTFLKNAAEADRKYVTLDNPSDLMLAKTEPKLFFEKYSPPVLIDEIQYAPELFVYIKMIVDNSDQPGRIWMTWSQQYDMMRGITDSLAGRVAILDMFGFSIYERAGIGKLQKPFLPSKSYPCVLGRKTAAETFRMLWQGSFPAVVDGGSSERTGFTTPTSERTWSAMFAS